jgi:hypothetical protein
MFIEQTFCIQEVPMNATRSIRSINLSQIWNKVMSRRGSVFGFMIFGALLAFEIFNYSTTQFALQDVLGDLKFLGIAWATILALAFCGIDFAGIARIFTPEQGRDEPAEVWYLFGAWLLAAAMNATLTWWGVSIAMENRQIAGTAIINSSTMMTAVPVFVAVMVWVIRILIIGTFSSMGDRLFRSDARSRRPMTSDSPVRPQTRPSVSQPIRSGATLTSYRPQPRPAVSQSPYKRPESTLSAKSVDYDDSGYTA